MKKKTAHVKKSVHPSDSVIIQVGVAVIVVSGFALLAYTITRFLP